MHEEVGNPFDYDVLDEQARGFVLQKTMETHGLLKRMAEHIIQIGQNLLSIKECLGHGYFEAWLQAEFALSARQARRFMLVAERFAGKTDKMSVLPISVLYELASPSTSESIIEQVESHQIPATVSAIREAREAERQAQVRQAALQEQLEQERATAAAEIGRLALELERAQAELAQAELAQLSAKASSQTQEVPAEVSAELESLQRQVSELTQECEALARQAAELEARLLAAGQEEEKYEREVRLAWSNATASLHTNLLKFLAQFPTPQQALVFEMPDWNHLDQAVIILQRVLDECERLRQGSHLVVVEAMPGSGASASDGRR
jgi:hypothetical protein